MNQLTVPFTEYCNSNTALTTISNLLDHATRNPVSITPWLSYAYKPDVSFAILHCNDAILLKYYVDETYTRARFHNINEHVYNDSCVEFFIGFDRLPSYYNLEFNCLGTALAGYGEDKKRELLHPDIIRKIQTYSSLQPGFKEGPQQWELTVVIPVALFCYDNITGLKGRKTRANFFKCGEQLPQRHYCMWARIDSPQPDFHLPAYFGAMEFE